MTKQATKHTRPQAKFRAIWMIKNSLKVPVMLLQSVTLL
jgi:hypothetical protein